MSDQSKIWSTLRTKDDVADDADWQLLQLLPSTLRAVVGGTASNGTYSITISGTLVLPNGSIVEVDETISALRDAAETSAQMAVELETNANANNTLARLGFVFDVDTATLLISAPPGFRGTLSRVVPGSATITFSIGSRFRGMGCAPTYAGASNDVGKVVVSVFATDGGVPLAPNAAFTFTMTPIEVAMYKDDDNVLRYRVQEGEPITDCLLDTDYVIPMRGAFYWTVRLEVNADIADVPSGTDGFRVLTRDAGME